jgi:hypothetical protein
MDVSDILQILGKKILENLSGVYHAPIFFFMLKFLRSDKFVSRRLQIVLYL